MAPRPAAPLSLLVLVVCLREGCFGGSHSLKYFQNYILDIKQGSSYFVSVGYMDGQLFSSYDSSSGKERPRVSWMERFKKEYWDSQSEIGRLNEERFRRNLEILRNRYNQSKGFHITQQTFGCEERKDGSKLGFEHHGYDGKTFLTFDQKTLSWVALDTQAQITQRKWNAIPGFNQKMNLYLDEDCFDWLKTYLSYGRETLLRKETPVVTVSSRMEAEDGMETHVCRVDGFYPREIDATWRRDREVWLQDTFHGSVAPNSDGTYHYWLSIQIDPKERDRYRCHVEHDSLKEPLDVALIEYNQGLIIGCVAAALVLGCVVIAGICFFRKPQNGYRGASSD